MKLIFKISGIISLSLIILLLFFLLIFSSEKGEKYLKKTAEEKLSSILGNNVEIGNLETNLLSYLNVKNIKIADKNDETSEKILYLESGSLKYSIAVFPSIQLNISEISLDSLYLNLQTDSTGNLSIISELISDTTTKENSKKSDIISFETGKLNLNRSIVVYNDKKIELQGILAGLNAEVNSKVESGYEFEINGKSLELDYQSLPLSISGIHVNGLFAENKLKINSLNLSTYDLNLNGSGSINLDDDASLIDAELKLTGPVRSIANRFKSFIPQSLLPQKGKIDLTCNIEGQTGDLDFKVDLSIPTLDFPAGNVENLKSGLTWQDGKLTIERFSTVFNDGKVNLSATYLSANKYVESLELEFDSIQFSEIWQAIFNEVSPYDGIAAGSINLNGPLDKPVLLDVDGFSKLKDVKYNDVKIPPFTTRIKSFQNRTRITFEHQTSSLALEFNNSLKNLDGTLSFVSTEISPLTELMNLHDIGGKLKIDGRIEGKVKNPLIKISFTGNELYAYQVPIDTLYGNIRYSDKKLNNISCYASSGWTGIEQEKTPFNLDKMGGSYKYDLELSGSLDDPEAELKLEMKDATYDKISLDELNGDFVYSDNTLTVISSKLRRENLYADIEGSHDLSSGKNDFDIRVFTGTDSFSVISLPSQNSLSLYTSKNGSFRKIGSVNVISNISDLNNLRISLKKGSVNLESLNDFVSGTDALNGNLEFGAKLAGNLQNPDGEINIFVEKPGFNEVQLDSLLLRAVISPEKLIVKNLSLFSENTKSVSEASLDLVGNENGIPSYSDESFIHFSSQTDGLDLRLINLLSKNDIVKAGICSYKIKGNGPLENLIFNGEISVDDGSFKTFEKSPLIDRVNAKISLNDSLIYVENLEGNLNKLQIRLKADILQKRWKDFALNYNMFINNQSVLSGKGVYNPGNLDFVINSDNLNLKVIRPISNHLERVDGLLQSALHVYGSPENPSVDGSLSITNITFNHPQLPNSISKGYLSLHFDKKNVIIDSSGFNLDKGIFKAKGSLSHKNGIVENASINANVNKVKYEKSNNYFFNIDKSDLTVNYDKDLIKVDGNITLGESKYIRKFQPKELLSFFRPSTRIAEQNSNLKKINLNIRIKSEQNAWIDNNLALIKLKVDLLVSGTPDNPKINGLVMAKDGYILFLDKKFEITNGNLDFVEVNGINPIVELEATSKLKSFQTVDGQEYEVYLTITGPADNAEVSLTSAPSLPETDIISLLTLGATRDQLAGRDPSGNSVADIFRQRAEGLTSQKISRYISKNIGNTLGLEKVTVEGNLFRLDNAWGPQIVATRKITNRVDLTYSARIGHMNEQGIKLDYRLTEHIALEGQTDQKGKSGLDIIFKWKFK